MINGISYGICLSQNYDTQTVQKLIDSINMQDHFNTPYEILIIGEHKNDLISHGKLIFIPFDESQKKGWITRKKNILADKAAFDVLCLMHDYYMLSTGWFDGIQRYDQENPNWSVLCNRITRYEGDRHSDWLVNQKYMDVLIYNYPELSKSLMSVAPTEENGPRWVCGLPYDEKGLTHIQYISGGYILVKTDVLRQFRFDESYAWGEAAEDIIWSEYIIKNGIRFFFNPYSLVTLQKPKKWKVYQMTDDCVLKLKELFVDERI